jgi:diamine N-acetyltransferase
MLESDIVRLRALEPEDVDILYKWENDTNVWKVSNTVVPFSRHILRQFIDSQKYDVFETRQLRLIIEAKDSGRPVGTIDLFDIDPYNRRAGIGVLIYDKKERCQGYASSALQILIRNLIFLHTLSACDPRRGWTRSGTRCAAPGLCLRPRSGLEGMPCVGSSSSMASRRK